MSKWILYLSPAMGQEKRLKLAHAHRHRRQQCHSRIEMSECRRPIQWTRFQVKWSEQWNKVSNKETARCKNSNSSSQLIVIDLTKDINKGNHTEREKFFFFRKRKNVRRATEDGKSSSSPFLFEFLGQFFFVVGFIKLKLSGLSKI